MTQRLDVRNFAIIAHIDHGKTTLVDHMLRQAGVFRANEDVPERVMDSNEQERERGITILAKNTAITYRGVKMNILDTPGHADFGGEVERVLGLADGVILLVDAAEGPLPQTRFVLSKALEKKLPPLVVINKIDRKDARPEEVLDEVLDLFIDLGADEDALDFPVLFAIAREGVAKKSLDDHSRNLEPLFESILASVPSPLDRRDEPLQILIANTDYDDYVGTLGIGRIVCGEIRSGQALFRVNTQGPSPAKVMRLYGFEGLAKKEIEVARSGDLVAIAGIEELDIGDTVVATAETPALPRIAVDPPTIRMSFLVNDSPFAGTEGKHVTSRKVRERLFKAAKQNVAIRVADGETPDRFEVSGRGELQLAVLVEAMRREGYELQLGKPEVVIREIDGKFFEPMERLTIDVPEEFIGVVTERLADRKGEMLDLSRTPGGRAKLSYRIPSRGLIGFRSQFLTQTRGLGVLNSIVDGWSEWKGAMARRPNGGIVADRKGRTTPYALFHLQSRGVFFVGPNVDVYEGMVVGENTRENDLDVDVTREKKLVNFRSANKDDNTILSPPRPMTLEQAMEFIDEDELIEVTPESIRLRKRILAGGRRPKRVAREE
ncbi:MAG: translational GTPase TypA [Deltaproteobacteria bacterium]|nr:translational GTPase TypA [Deltaproteobacteria bacterium]